MAERRSGVLTFGSFITDHNLAIEHYPPEDQTTFIARPPPRGRRAGLQHGGGPAPARSGDAGRVPWPPRRRRERQGGPRRARPPRHLAGRDDPHGQGAAGLRRGSWRRRRPGRRTFFFFRGNRRPCWTSTTSIPALHMRPNLPPGCAGASPAPGPAASGRRETAGRGSLPAPARSAFRTNMEMASLEGETSAPHRAAVPSTPRQHRHQRPRRRGG